MKTFEAQDPKTFLKSFLAHAGKAQTRIWIQTMNFDQGDRLRAVVELLKDAARRGLDVRMNVDWMAEQFADEHFDFSPLIRLINFNSARRMRYAHAQRMQMYKELREAGVQLLVTNRPNPLTYALPVIGRNHIKMYVVDDDVAWIGGVNLMERAIDHVDVMVKITSKSVIESLIAQFPLVNDAIPDSDYEVQHGDSTLIVDSGRFNTSLIFETAMNTIRHAEKSILLVSQMTPDFALLNVLKSASKRGVQITIITSKRNDALFNKLPYKLTYQAFLRSTKHDENISLVHTDKKVHMKLLIIDDATAIVGSHNFSQMGGWFGTQEIALQTQDATLVADLKCLVERYL